MNTGSSRILIILTDTRHKNMLDPSGERSNGNKSLGIFRILI